MSAANGRPAETGLDGRSASTAATDGSAPHLQTARMPDGMPVASRTLRSVARRCSRG